MGQSKHTLRTRAYFIGGVNSDRIGGNCQVIEHIDEKGEVTRVMFDLGSLFTPYATGFTEALPNVDEYFDRIDLKTGDLHKATKPVSALFLTHAHQDHIGAIATYMQMGYQIPTIYTSEFTRSFMFELLKGYHLKSPQMKSVKVGEISKISPSFQVEAFDVSHSVIGSMGFCTLTKENGKPYATLVNNGDFLTATDMPLGDVFDIEAYLKMLKRNQSPHMVMMIDSTSTNPNGSERIGFEQAVQNLIDVIKKNPDRTLIVSPVLSRSIQNIAIDIEAARRLGIKIYLAGPSLQTVYKAMKNAGFHDFDDVISEKTDLAAYLKQPGLKYIVGSGAFAQGLEEYDENRETMMLSFAVQLALDRHPILKLTSPEWKGKVLFLERQRIIDEINGQTGPKMLQLLAAQGVKVVMAPWHKKIADFEQVQMQDSGHINDEDLEKFMSEISKDIAIIPIHGSPKQCQETAELAQKMGFKTALVLDQDVYEVGEGAVQDEQKGELTWYGVKQIWPSEERPNVPLDGIKEIHLVDEEYRDFNPPVILGVLENDSGQHYTPHDDKAIREKALGLADKKPRLSRKQKKKLLQQEKEKYRKTQENQVTTNEAKSEVLANLQREKKKYRELQRRRRGAISKRLGYEM